MIKEINLNPINKNIISALENLLKRANEGKIQAIAVAGINSDCTSFNNFDGYYHPVLLLGEIRLLERDVIDVCCDTRRKVDWDFIE